MGLKAEFEHLTTTVTDAVDGVRHGAHVAASEAAHRSQAHAEEVKRADAGGSLSALEVTKSVAKEIRQKTLAQVDALRQAIRKKL